MRNIAFLTILTILWVPGLSIIIFATDLFGMGDSVAGNLVVNAIVLSGPIIAKDASLVGEVTPFAFAGALVLLAPKKSETRILIASICISAVGWLIYLTLSVLLNDGSATYEALLTVIEGATGNVENSAILQAFSTGTRVLYLVVAASLLGLKIRKEQ